MLTSKERLAGGMIGADLHTIARAVDLRVSRYNLVVDDRGHECGTVTGIYRLVQNAEVISALDLATDNLGVDLECDGGMYASGKSSFGFFTGDEFNVPGDTSGLRQRFTLDNDYGGTGKLKGISGTYRLICGNGMSVGEIYTSMGMRHVGDFNLLEVMETMLRQALEYAAQEQTRAVIQASTEFNLTENSGLITAIGQDTPKRYRNPLGQSIIDYQQTVGQTVWALTQAIAEIGTHDMSNTRTAQAWARRNQTRVLETVGI